MSVTLELTPEMERKIATAAVASGLSVESYLLTIVEREVGTRAEPFHRESDIRAMLDELAADDSHLPKEELRYDREDIYWDEE